MKIVKNVIKKILPEMWLKRIRMAYIAPLEGREWHMLSWGAPATYKQDGVLSVHATGFGDDVRFNEAYARGKATKSWGDSDVHWRIYIVCWAAYHASKLGPGDFVEAGSNRGGSALTMINYLGEDEFKERKLYLMDTFSGVDLSRLNAQEQERFKSPAAVKAYAECFEDVKQTFSRYNFVHLVRGSIPGTLSQVNQERVLFLHIDLNSAGPEVATLAYFWDRIPVGGVVVFDDYGWIESSEQKKALDQYAKEKSVKILALPTGQGLLIKS